MARYDTRVAASAIGVSEQWLSSLLTRFPIAGVVRGRQGFRRQLSVDAVVCAALTRTLTEEMSLPAEAAVALAHELMMMPGSTTSRSDGTLTLACDLPRLRRRIRSALDAAVALSTEVPRGRPPTRKQTRS